MGEFAESAPAASFPVVLFDGEREIEFGSILVHPSLGFRRFQTIISQKIGISVNQISSSLVRRKKARSSPEIARKVPINESSDFSAISRERNCFVLVTLKRPLMRARSRRRRGGDSAYAEEPDQKKAAAVAPKKILKRNPADGSGIGFPFDPAALPEELAARSFVCDLCRAQGMEGRSPAFHWCVYDAVTVGFRSSVGPIQRPLKKHIDDALA
ncbi:hypothetical protein KSP39_PZI020901 [Platanthera zijinensis]|uniref:DUF7138 domain-containing protein n=1 Tax=Platanthera zijinensis TaxID=2320716 RepID=A0AAP0AYZ4_9ASPA